MSDRLKFADVVAADLPDWQMMRDALYATYSTGGFAAGMGFVARITEAAEAANHHPDVTVTYPQVEVKLSSHDVGGVTQRDLDLARTISALASEEGYEAVADHTLVEFGLDTPHGPKLATFWAAILGGQVTDEQDDDRVTVGTHVPQVWFQPAEEPAELPAQRWHPDVWVPHDQAEVRIKAALDAGGTLVDDTHVPSYWVLADPDGNKVCLCTSREG